MVSELAFFVMKVRQKYAFYVSKNIFKKNLLIY